MARTVNSKKINTTKLPSIFEVDKIKDVERLTFLYKERLGNETVIGRQQTPYKADYSIQYVYLKSVLETVSEATKINIDYIKSKSRIEEYVYARYIFCYIARNFATMKIPVKTIGMIINCDHSTVLNALKMTPDYYNEKPSFKESLDQCLDLYVTKKQMQDALNINVNSIAQF